LHASNEDHKAHLAQQLKNKATTSDVLLQVAAQQAIAKRDFVTRDDLTEVLLGLQQKIEALSSMRTGESPEMLETEKAYRASYLYIIDLSER